jgi:hypothetical protein
MQLSILLPHERPLNPAIKLAGDPEPQPDHLAARDKQANRFQTQLLSVIHADVYTPA